MWCRLLLVYHFKTQRLQIGLCPKLMQIVLEKLSKIGVHDVVDTCGMTRACNNNRGVTHMYKITHIYNKTQGHLYHRSNSTIQPKDSKTSALC